MTRNTGPVSSRAGSRAEAVTRLKSLIESGEPVRGFVDQRAITAEHEAAHVVAYLAMGCGFHHAEVEPDCYTEATPEPVLRDEYTIAVTSIAGIVVEDRYRQVPLAQRVVDAVEWAEECDDDPSGLDDMEIFGRHPEMATASYQHAEMILAGFAGAHAEIADALYERGHLDRDDLAALPLTSELLARVAWA